jgi:6-pyruvoyltetrahydropterin/6-carboxytetrahydropterin synthase
MYTVEIVHNFETAHRLSDPGSPVKCMSIHGHSWLVTVVMEGEELDQMGILVEFGAFKRAWRGWLDDHVDHHLVLRRNDPLAAAILAVYPEQRLLLLDENPTTEVMARVLHDEASRIVAELETHVPVRVRRVHVQETRVNAATWEPTR